MVKQKPPEKMPCPCCDGMGYFSPWGKPSKNPGDRPCMECDGKGYVFKDKYED